jgi:hypothetical protein
MCIHCFPSCWQLHANNQESGLKKLTKQKNNDGTNTATPKQQKKKN